MALATRLVETTIGASGRHGPAFTSVCAGAISDPPQEPPEQSMLLTRTGICGAPRASPATPVR